MYGDRSLHLLWIVDDDSITIAFDAFELRQLSATELEFDGVTSMIEGPVWRQFYLNLKSRRWSEVVVHVQLDEGPRQLDLLVSFCNVLQWLQLVNSCLNSKSEYMVQSQYSFFNLGDELLKTLLYQQILLLDNNLKPFTHHLSTLPL